MPSREEIVAYITAKAQELGIDPQVALRIAQGESGMNPAAVGDAGQSGGLFQLYRGGGLGNEFEKATGLNPLDPSGWKQQVDFSLEQAAKQGGPGWEPWHARKRPDVNVGQFEGLPGQSSQQPQQPGRRDRANEVARGGGPMVQPNPNAAPPAPVTNAWGLTKEEMLNITDPVGPPTLAGALFDKLGVNDPNARRSQRSHTPIGALVKMFMPESATPKAPGSEQTLAGGLLDAFKKPPNKEVAKATAELGKKVNPYAWQSEEAQLASKAKPKRTLASIAFGTQAPEDPLKKRPTTLLGGLFGPGGLFG